jgi:predicted metal-dependent HD superfamily phosphohydrolase
MSHYLNDKIMISAIYDENEKRGLCYHNNKHINYMLKNANRYFLRLLDEESADILRTAILYHDIIYVPGATDNEERSITLFRTLNNGSTEFKDKVSSLIMATKTHKTEDMCKKDIFKLDPRVFELSKMISDLDLLSLATDTFYPVSDGNYESTTGLVIQEAKNFGFEMTQITNARIKFLTEYYNRPNLYHTPPFSEFEEQAKRRMANQLYEVNTASLFEKVEKLKEQTFNGVNFAD